MQNMLAILLVLLAVVGFCQIMIITGLHSLNIRPGEITLEGRVDRENFLRVLQCVKQAADDLPFTIKVRIIFTFPPDVRHQEMVLHKFGGRAEIVKQPEC